MQVRKDLGINHTASKNYIESIFNIGIFYIVDACSFYLGKFYLVCIIYVDCKIYKVGIFYEGRIYLGIVYLNRTFYLGIFNIASIFYLVRI